ncbi:MAG: hypothetical protein ACRED1_08080, partial [Limisphaerales bacterium]
MENKIGESSFRRVAPGERGSKGSANYCAGIAAAGLAENRIKASAQECSGQAGYRGAGTAGFLRRWLKSRKPLRVKVYGRSKRNSIEPGTRRVFGSYPPVPRQNQNIASTFFLTASSILISGGQLRLKPSPASFFVASIPSLLPAAIS